MTSGFAQTSRSHWMLLLAVVLLLRAFVPQGWMLGEDAAGGITVEICNSDQQIVIPMKDGADHPQDDAEKDGEPCAFSANTAAATPPDGTATLPLPQLAEAVYDATRAVALSPDGYSVLPPATGPPTLA